MSFRVRLLAQACWTVLLVMLVAWIVRGAGGSSGSRTLKFRGSISDSNGKPSAGPLDLSFEFRTDSTLLCEALVGGVPVDPATGNVNVEIPIESCPSGLLASEEVLVDVLVGSERVVVAQP